MAWTTPGTAVAGDVLTAAFWNTNVRDNLADHEARFKQYAYVSRNTNATITATSFATASEYFSTDATWTADGTSTYFIEAYLPGTNTITASHATYFALSDGGSTQLGIMGQMVQLAGVQLPIRMTFPWVPSSGSKSVNLKIYVNGNSTEIYAGNGGSDFYYSTLRVLGPA